MSDPNDELVAKLARERADYHAWQRANEAPTVYSGDWNAPIDTIQADCLSLRNLIRGWIGDLKDEAWRWEPAPCPPMIALPETEEIRHVR